MTENQYQTVPLPCPFCGATTFSTHLDNDQGTKWGYAQCDSCGATGPEVRTDYDRSEDAPWRLEAVSEWNGRAHHAPITKDEIREAFERWPHSPALDFKLAECSLSHRWLTTHFNEHVAPVKILYLNWLTTFAWNGFNAACEWMQKREGSNQK